MSTSGYQIIDEPKPKLASHLIVSPIIILLAGMLVPHPYRYLAVLWLLFNSWCLGSHTFRKECLYVVGGVIFIWVNFFVLGLLMQNAVPGFRTNAFAPYFGIYIYAVYLALLYLIYLKQSPVYALWSYIKEQQENG